MTEITRYVTETKLSGPINTRGHPVGLVFCVDSNYIQGVDNNGRIGTKYLCTPTSPITFRMTEIVQNNSNSSNVIPGHCSTIYNFGSSTISIQDSTGTSLYTLDPNFSVKMIAKDALTNSWQQPFIVTSINGSSSSTGDSDFLVQGTGLVSSSIDDALYTNNSLVIQQTSQPIPTSSTALLEVQGSIHSNGTGSNPISSAGVHMAFIPDQGTFVAAEGPNLNIVGDNSAIFGKDIRAPNSNTFTFGQNIDNLAPDNFTVNVSGLNKINPDQNGVSLYSQSIRHEYETAVVKTHLPSVNLLANTTNIVPITLTPGNHKISGVIKYGSCFVTFRTVINSDVEMFESDYSSCFQDFAYPAIIASKIPTGFNLELTTSASFIPSTAYIYLTDHQL